VSPLIIIIIIIISSELIDFVFSFSYFSFLCRALD